MGTHRRSISADFGSLKGPKRPVYGKLMVELSGHYTKFISKEVIEKE